MRKALAVDRKELRQIPRDRRTLLILVFIPAFFLLLYGYALNFDIRHIALAVDDRDGTSESRHRRLRVRELGLLRSGRGHVFAGRCRAAARPEPGTRACCHSRGVRRDVSRSRSASRSSSTATTPTPRRRYWATRPASSARSARDSSSAALTSAARHRRAAHLVQPGAPEHALPRARPDRLHRHDHRRGLDRASRSCVRRSSARWSRCGWRRSTRCRSSSGRRCRTSSSPWHRRPSSSSPRWFFFGLPMRGSWLELLAADGVSRRRARTGLLISTIADSQQLAFQLALLIAFLPTFMLSGFIFPITSMPLALQVITYRVPCALLPRGAARHRLEGGGPGRARRRSARLPSTRSRRWRSRRCASRGSIADCGVCAFSSGRSSSS